MLSVHIDIGSVEVIVAHIRYLHPTVGSSEGNADIGLASAAYQHLACGRVVAFCGHFVFVHTYGGQLLGLSSAGDKSLVVQLNHCILRLYAEEYELLLGKCIFLGFNYFLFHDRGRLGNQGEPVGFPGFYLDREGVFQLGARCRVGDLH